MDEVRAAAVLVNHGADVEPGRGDVDGARPALGAHEGDTAVLGRPSLEQHHAVLEPRHGEANARPGDEIRAQRRRPGSIRRYGAPARLGSRRRLWYFAVQPTREQAWATLTEYTKSEALLRHALAVEASVGHVCALYGEDEEFWGATRSCTTSTTRSTPRSTSIRRMARRSCATQGYPEELVESVLSHAEHLEMPRDTQLKRVLFACDELSGFVHACGLVRPTGLDGLEPKSVKKKLKQPSFAAGVHRDEVYEGAELLELSSTSTSQRRRSDAADREGARSADCGGHRLAARAVAGRGTAHRVYRRGRTIIVVSSVHAELSFIRPPCYVVPDVASDGELGAAVVEAIQSVSRQHRRRPTTSALRGSARSSSRLASRTGRHSSGTPSLPTSTSMAVGWTSSTGPGVGGEVAG